MEIIIHQAILHVLDTTLDAPVLSGGGMELTAEKTAYLQNHIEKLLASDEIRQCRPLPDSAFRNELEHNQDFIDLSCRIAGVLFDYMHAHTTIPGADLAVVDFTRDGAPWLGILKLNYKNGYTHYTETVEGAPVNSIIQQRACLPTQSGKVEEGALVNLTDYSMRLLEKKYDIDGHKEFYLSSVVFQYTQAEPEKKKLQAIQEAAAQAVKDAYEDEPHADAQVAMLIASQAADNDNQVSVEQVRQQLTEEYPLAAVPFDDYVEKSEVLEEAAAPVTVTPARIRRMESRSIRTANGIEVKIPTELLNSDSELEFLHDPDGSVSLLIKNVIL
ncbi:MULTISPECIES: nucleoid-associated protein [Faecalibacterium]|uniref:Nucleoid-associated protein n=1 Tax=Faecalibacterium hominis (ex Afrizal et al. 2022) TaxID=2881265 RepID=A0ABS8FCN1_9FIRM|nr:nucleoid-associated protein [Faecalibacterium hominis (ex Afrizal et al. 2022)]MCC2212280.1 nucleoid-associated protein [Faecalibacterium hominis (ex Afrizal et al. 2022)]